jgi:hypothetical protein
MYAFMHVSLRWTKGGEFMNTFVKIFFMNDPGGRGRDVDINPDSSPPPPSPRGERRLLRYFHGCIYKFWMGRRLGSLSSVVEP